MACRSNFHVCQHMQSFRLALAIGVAAAAFTGVAATQAFTVNVDASGNIHSEVKHHSQEDPQVPHAKQDQFPAVWGVAAQGEVTSEIEEGMGAKKAVSRFDSHAAVLQDDSRMDAKKAIIMSDNHAAVRQGDPEDDSNITREAAAFLPDTHSLFSAPEGVVRGACANFRKTGSEDVSVSCPQPLKMVGCSCKDKVGQNTGSCGTKFKILETCNAFTKASREITAFVRCCHLDWVHDFQVLTSERSEAGDGKGVVQTCPAGKTLLGCACVPADAPNNGCKHTQVQGAVDQHEVLSGTPEQEACLATNLKGHDAGVKSQALCATIPSYTPTNNSDMTYTSAHWESVATPAMVIDKPTNLSCSKPHLHMISCSCGSDTGMCNGGKVLGNKCECVGKSCFASARCADIPIPPTHCLWNFWGEWSACSTSCGDGTRSRVREIAMIAMNGGTDCTGSDKMNAHCTGDYTNQCNTTHAKAPEDKFNHWTLFICGLVIGVCFLGSVCVRKYHDKGDDTRNVSLVKAREDDYGNDDYSGEGGSYDEAAFTVPASLAGGGNSGGQQGAVAVDSW